MLEAIYINAAINEFYITPDSKTIYKNTILNHLCSFKGLTISIIHWPNHCQVLQGVTSTHYIC